VALEHRGVTLLFKEVPAEFICADCGEAYLDDDITRQILPAAEEAVRVGVQVDMHEFIVEPEGIDGMEVSRLGIIADDLTGAMDTGGQLANTGLRTVVYLVPALVGEEEISILDTESRDLPRQVAGEKVREAAHQLSGRTIYKKIDSTLRGNVGYEIDAAMDELGLTRALIAPSFPATGRTTAQGYLFVHGVTLRQTDFVQDPLCPETDHVPTLLRSQSKRSVGHIGLEVVEQGREALLKEVKGRKEQFLVVDATREAHLRRIAHVAVCLGTDCLSCGSAGLAQALAMDLSRGTASRPSATPRSNRWPVLIVAGSRRKLTKRQIEQVLSAGQAVLVEIDPLQFDGAAQQTISIVHRRLAEGKHVILTTAFAPHRPEEKETAATWLGEMAAEVARLRPLSGLVLTGGATAFATCRAMGIRAIQIENEVAPGIPVGVVLEGDWEGTRLVTKAGGFGEADALLQSVRYLRGESGDA